ncbi:MAG: peptidylprolyl isomerase [Candidatus Latescibacterota bacterium]|nr:MAG: peptidylprolyl isomerase [Candidatus Latescibacterota bacterium]
MYWPKSRAFDLTIGGLALPIVLFVWAVGCERRSVHTGERESPVLVRVDGEALTKHDFDLFLPSDYQDVLTADEKRECLDRWITTQLLYDEAIRRGLGVSPDIDARLEHYKKDLVAHELVQKVIQERAVVTEAEARAYYDEHREEYLKEFRVSHILVDTPEAAEKVRSLLGSKSFTYLARRYSIDKHTHGGGDLGYLSRGNMLPEFEDVVFSMKVGDVSDVIESEFGYHIIKITDIRDARFTLDFADVAMEVEQILTLNKRNAVYDSLVATLRSNAKIEIVDDVFGLNRSDDGDSLSQTPEPE